MISGSSVRLFSREVCHLALRVGLGLALIVQVGAVLVSSAGAQSVKPGRLVIVGGALEADNESVYRAILDGRSGTGPFCVIPTAGATPETGMATPVAAFDRWGGAGTAKGVLISVNKPETARDPAVVAQLRACSGFFFIGGIQTRVSAAFRPDGNSTPAYDALMQRWREGAVVSGSSAGAAIMSDPMIASGVSANAFTRGVKQLPVGAAADVDDATAGLTMTQGLGLFPAALADQHFLSRGRFGRLLVALVDLDQYDLAFGVDENTALVVDGNSVRAVGASGVTVFDERGATRSATRSGRSEAGIVMHLMGAGDRFDLTTRTLTQMANKSPLPQATGDSAIVLAPKNAFAAWEFLHVLDRLGRSPQTELSMPVTGGEIIVRKSTGFRAVSTAASAAGSSAGAGVQKTPAGLGMTGLTVELRRP